MATSPAQWPLVVWKNGDWEQPAAITDDAGAPFDLTNYELAMQVRLYQGATGDALIDLATVGSAIEGIQITDDEAGEFTILIDQATLEALPATNGENKPSVFHHDLILIAPDGLTEVYAYGSFTVNTGVTR